MIIRAQIVRQNKSPGCTCHPGDLFIPVPSQKVMTSGSVTNELKVAVASFR